MALDDRVHIRVVKNLPLHPDTAHIASSQQHLQLMDPCLSSRDQIQLARGILVVLKRVDPLFVRGANSAELRGSETRRQHAS